MNTSTEVTNYTIISILVLYRVAQNSIEQISQFLNLQEPKGKGKWILNIGGKKCIYFKKGTAMIGGLKNPSQINIYADNLNNYFREANPATTIEESKIINIVTKFDFDQKIDLSLLFKKLQSENCSYDPEFFPGLIYKNWEVSFLLFSSGKSIMTGAKRIEDLNKKWLKFQRLINEEVFN